RNQDLPPCGGGQGAGTGRLGLPTALHRKNLKSPSCRTDFWDLLKYLRCGAARRPLTRCPACPLITKETRVRRSRRPASVQVLTPWKIEEHECLATCEFVS